MPQDNPPSGLIPTQKKTFLFLRVVWADELERLKTGNPGISSSVQFSRNGVKMLFALDRIIAPNHHTQFHFFV
jgi:hypothetical protein